MIKSEMPCPSCSKPDFAQSISEMVQEKLVGDFMIDSTFVLPYAIKDADRKKPFSHSMELASLFHIAETDRKKKSGLLGGKAELLVSLAKLYYPIWLVSGDEHRHSYVLDGLKIASDEIHYSRPPDVESFIEHLKRSAETREVYHSTMGSHRETFSGFISQTKIPIEGFVTSKEQLSAILALSQRKEKTRKDADEVPLLNAKITEKQAAKIGEEICSHLTKLNAEIETMQSAVDLLRRETQKHVGKLQRELKQALEKYEDRISEAKIRASERKAELDKERSAKIEQVMLIHKKELNARLLEKRDWERKLLRMESEKSKIEKQKRKQEPKKNIESEPERDSSLQEINSQISTIKGKLKALSRFLDQSSKETEKATKKLDDDYQKLMHEEDGKVKSLEDSRALSVDMIEKATEELEKETRGIARQIEQLIDQKMEGFSSLKEAAIPWRVKSPTVVGLPFYVAKYNASGEIRYVLHSPVIVRGTEGFVTKLQKTFRGSGAFLKLQSKALDKMLKHLESELNTEESSDLRKNADQLSMSFNMLKAQGFKEKVKRGLAKIEAEGWIKAEEKSAILQNHNAE